jgi:tripartite-type tricarboxylate transporter receptor subunit TctC
MTIARRRFLRLATRFAAGIAALPATARLTRAETFPARPVHMVVGFPAGNAPDIIARLVGDALSPRLGQPVVVENRPGAGSTIASEAVGGAAADGYTVMMVVLSNAINASLYPNLRYDFGRDFAHVAGFCNAPYVLVINPAVPAKTVPEFIAYAKANPGKINFASGGTGTTTHVFGEFFKMLTKVEMVHIPYRSNYMPDLLGNQIQAVFMPIPQAMEQVRAGKLRALGVSTAARLAALPDVPTIAESVPEYVATGWYGLSAPKSTPAEVVDRINAAVGNALADAKIVARLASLGVDPMPMRPADFKAFIDRDTEKWGKVIKYANIKPE